MERVPWNVGSGMRLGCEEKGRGDTKKTCITAGWAVYIYYFKDIRQGALQFDCLSEVKAKSQYWPLTYNTNHNTVFDMQAVNI